MFAPRCRGTCSEAARVQSGIGVRRWGLRGLRGRGGESSVAIPLLLISIAIATGTIAIAFMIWGRTRSPCRIRGG